MKRAPSQNGRPSAVRHAGGTPALRAGCIHALRCILPLFLLIALTGPRQDRVIASDRPDPPETLVTQAAAALNEGAAGALGPAFAGDVPQWARDWVTRLRGSLGTRRRWTGHVVRLPRPYRGDDQLAVFATYHPIEADGDHFYTLRRRGGAWRLGREIAESEPLNQYRITAHELEVRLLPAEHTVDLVDRMTAERLRGAGALLLARMNEDFVVTEVRITDQPTPFARAGGLLAICVPDTVRSGSFPVTLRYRGTVHHPGWDDVAEEGTLLFSYWYPNIGRSPARGTVTVTAPSGWTIIGQGSPRAQEDDGKQARAVWEQPQPVCWLQIAAGRFHTTRRQVGRRTYAVHLRQPDPAKAEAALTTIQRAMEFYTERFGPVPWDRYEVVEYPLAPGAIESYTFTAAQRGLIPSALNHELAHSWWGGFVPNTYLDDMWSEAFATYSTRLLGETIPPEGRRPSGRGAPRRFSAGQWAVPISQANNPLDPSHSPVGYNKGAAVLHVLRRLLGDDSFLASLRRFQEARAGRASTWRDYQKAAEQASGRRLRWFFDQWLNRPGVPTVTLEDLRFAQTPDGKWEARFTVRQEGEPYRLMLPLEFILANGERTRSSVAVRRARESVRVPLPGRPNRVRLDPEGDLLLGGERREWEFLEAAPGSGGT